MEEIQNFHAELVDTFNTTAHYAHRERPDGRDVAHGQAGIDRAQVEFERLGKPLQDAVLGQLVVTLPGAHLRGLGGAGSLDRDGGGNAEVRRDL